MVALHLMVLIDLLQIVKYIIEKFFFLCLINCFDYEKVFIGKLPREIFEDELIPLCEEVGKIWDLRLMTDPASGFNKGYCFVTYCSQSDSAKACERVRFIF
jgi:hypothetical protein